jgi:hypothetical protein
VVEGKHVRVRIGEGVGQMRLFAIAFVVTVVVGILVHHYAFSPAIGAILILLCVGAILVDRLIEH